MDDNPNPAQDDNQPVIDPQDVPEEVGNAGTDTNEPQADSPETMDQALSEGDNRDSTNPPDMSGTTGTL